MLVFFFHIFFPPHVLWSCVCVNIANRCSHLFHFVLLLYFFKPTELKRFCCFPFWSLLKDANWKASQEGGGELYWFPIHSSNLFIRDLCYHTPINQNPGMVEAPGNQFVVEWILQQQAPLIARSNKLKPFRALGSVRGILTIEFPSLYNVKPGSYPGYTSLSIGPEERVRCVDLMLRLLWISAKSSWLESGQVHRVESSTVEMDSFCGNVLYQEKLTLHIVENMVTAEQNLIFQYYFSFQ